PRGGWAGGRGAPPRPPASIGPLGCSGRLERVEASGALVGITAIDPPPSVALPPRLPARLRVVERVDGLTGMFRGEPELEVLGEAANGAEAVARAEELRPDVILMDLRMPEMDGVTAIARLVERALPA